MNTSRAKQCTGKIRHATGRGARIAMIKTGELNADLALTFYRCRHCGFYHVGHPSKPEQKRLKVTRLLKLIAAANRKEPHGPPQIGR